MRIFTNLLIILCFFTAIGAVTPAQAEQSMMEKIKRIAWKMDRNNRPFRNARDYTPYLENARHTQHLQYKDEDWYVEDWTAQENGMNLVKKFYNADIFNDQKTTSTGMAELVVGPNFYHLSGLDKRRAVTLIDTVYGVTDNNENGAFIVSDWYTKKPIGVFDQHGLRLH